MIGSHQITSPEKARQFILAGNATFTLKSVKTGTRFTYRVRASGDKTVHFVSLMNGPDNEASFSYFGFIRRGVFHHGAAKARVAYDAPSVKAFNWTFRVLQQDSMPDALQFWHEGRCGKCNRKLTVPESLETGMGLDCAGDAYKAAPMGRRAKAVRVLVNEFAADPINDPTKPDFYLPRK